MKQVKTISGKTYIVRSCMNCPYNVYCICDMGVDTKLLSPYKCPEECPLDEAKL